MSVWSRGKNQVVVYSKFTEKNVHTDCFIGLLLNVPFRFHIPTSNFNDSFIFLLCKILGRPCFQINFEALLYHNLLRFTCIFLYWILTIMYEISVNYAMVWTCLYSCTLSILNRLQFMNRAPFTCCTQALVL